MYCRYCGTQLDDGTAFCIKCGKKTVKLRPRTQTGQETPIIDVQPAAPVLPPPVVKPTWQDKLKTTFAALIEKGGPAMTKLGEGVKSVFAAAFSFTRHFDAGMWAVCGVFLGLEIIALVEVIASVTGSGLLFAFLKDMPTVLLLAWLLCLVIAQVTLICGHNYKQSDEYKQAVSRVEEMPVDDPVQVPPLIIESAPAPAEIEQTQDAPPEMPVEAPVREKLSQEAEDIIAELEKLSLTL